mgnify:FL=1
MKRIIITLMFILLAQFCYADLSEELNNLKDNYNNNYEAPGIVKSLFGNEKINLYITDINATFKVTTEKAKITELEEGILEDHTLDVYTTEESIKKVIESDEPFEELIASIENKDITYKAATLISKIKYGIASFLSIFF